jgi:entericidin B
LDGRLFGLLLLFDDLYPSGVFMKKISAFLVVTSMMFALTACNTISGVGKDVQKAGQKVEEAAKK